MSLKPDSLFEICLEAVGCNVNPIWYESLPISLKEKLLLKLSKRGLCCSKGLVSLIHPHLNKLDLRECCISEESLLTIEGLKDLKYLFLPQPPLVNSVAYSEAALVKVVKGKQNLLSLSMSGLHGVSDRVIGVLVGGSPNLLVLQLQETLISNNALYFLANLASLQCLNIARTEVNDAGLEQLASGSAGQSLVELRLDGCRRLTRNSIRTMCNLMLHLNVLNFQLCPNLSGEDAASLLFRNKKVKQITWTVY